jgi:hypothetical protein
MEIPEEKEALEVNDGFLDSFDRQLLSMGVSPENLKNIYKVVDIYKENTITTEFDPEKDSIDDLLNESVVINDLELFLRDGLPLTRIYRLPDGRNITLSSQPTYIEELDPKFFDLKITHDNGFKTTMVSVPNGTMGSIIAALTNTKQTIESIQKDPVKLERFLKTNNKVIVTGVHYVDPFGLIQDKRKDRHDSMRNYSENISLLMPNMFNTLPLITSPEGQSQRSEFYMGVELLNNANFVGHTIQFLSRVMGFSGELEAKTHKGSNHYGSTVVGKQKDNSYKFNMNSFKKQRHNILYSLGLVSGK